MSNKFWYLTKQSLKKKLKSKWFIGVNIMLLVVIIAIININSIIAFFGGDFTEKTKVYVIDNTEISYPIFKESMKTIMDDEEKNVVIKESKKE